jgi:hypothetical protein
MILESRKVKNICTAAEFESRKCTKVKLAVESCAATVVQIGSEGSLSNKGIQFPSEGDKTVFLEHLDSAKAAVDEARDAAKDAKEHLDDATAIVEEARHSAYDDNRSIEEAVAAIEKCADAVNTAMDAAKQATEAKTRLEDLLSEDISVEEAIERSLKESKVASAFATAAIDAFSEAAAQRLEAEFAIASMLPKGSDGKRVIDADGQSRVPPEKAAKMALVAIVAVHRDAVRSSSVVAKLVKDSFNSSCAAKEAFR